MTTAEPPTNRDRTPTHGPPLPGPGSRGPSPEEELTTGAVATPMPPPGDAPSGRLANHGSSGPIRY